MNWDAIGAIGEIVGAIAVVATLAYLARQINQNSLAVQGQSDMDYTKELIAWTARQSANPELGKIWLKATNKEQMSADEKLRYLFLMTEWVHLADGCFRQYERGLMPAKMFEETIADGLVSYFDVEIFREWWDSGRAYLSPGFREFIDQRVKSGQSSFSIENERFIEALKDSD